MPDARVQLAVEIETEGAEQLTALRRELDSLRASARNAFAPLDAALAGVANRLRESRDLFGTLEAAGRRFFRDLLGEAGNFRDAFKRLLRDMLEFFLRTLARMVSAWFSSMRLLSNFSPGGFGAPGLGLSFPGGLFNVSVGTPPTFPSGGGVSLGGLVSTAAGALLGLFGGGSSSSNGPSDVEIQLQAERDMRQTFDAYRDHRLTASAAVSRIRSIVQQTSQALASRGSRGRASIDLLSRFAAGFIRTIRRIERRRRERARIVGSLPVPEFQFGGLVRPVNTVDGRVLAFLHPGEAVLNRRAVQALGAHRVQAFNQAAGGSGLPARHRGSPSFQGGGLVGQAEPIAAPATVNLGPIIIQNAGDPAATADAVIREIRRRARDRRLPSPV